jgi:putative hydrolase of the HAD superfamily
MKVVFWDFDGTLARRNGMWTGALVDALRRVSDATFLTPDDFRPYLRGGFPWHTPDRTVKHPDAASWWKALRPVLAAAFAATGADQDTVAEAVELVGEE